LGLYIRFTARFSPVLLCVAAKTCDDAPRPITLCISYCSLNASGQAGLWGVDAPADAPRSEKRAFGRPSVKRRAGLSSSSVVGLIAVSIRAIFYVGAAIAVPSSALRGAAVLLISPNNLGAVSPLCGSLEPLLEAFKDATGRSWHRLSRKPAPILISILWQPDF